MITLQVTPTQLHADSEGLFFLFIAFCVIVIIVNVAKLIKRGQENTKPQSNPAINVSFDNADKSTQETTGKSNCNCSVDTYTTTTFNPRTTLSNQPVYVQSSSMKNANFIAIDFETATLKRSACQLGIIVVKEGEIVKKINYLIKPPRNIYTPQCVAVHGITPEKTANAPTFDKVWEEVREYFESNFVVAHNIKFDLDVLYKSLDKYNLPYPIFMGMACTYEMTGLSLEDACKKYDIPLCNHHDGECDAEACARLFMKYLTGDMDFQTKVPARQEQPSNEASESSGRYHQQLRGDVLKKDLSEADPDNPFYDKKVVITGVFDIDRSKLADKLKKMGADIDTGITKRTNFVIIGEDAGPKKLEKIKELQEEGIDIQLIFEEELKAIISKYL